MIEADQNKTLYHKIKANEAQYWLDEDLALKPGPIEQKKPDQNQVRFLVIRLKLKRREQLKTTYLIYAQKNKFSKFKNINNVDGMSHDSKHKSLQSFLKSLLSLKESLPKQKHRTS